MPETLAKLAAQVVSVCTDSKIFLVLAESLTGGMAASALVAVPGASKVLLASIVAYHDAAKHQLLQVPAMTLTTFGAVSEQTAEAMASGARQQLVMVPDVNLARVVGLSTTGVAGPQLQEGKPVGRVHLGLADEAGVVCQSLDLFGERDQIREQTCVALFEFLLTRLGH